MIVTPASSAQVLDPAIQSSSGKLLSCWPESGKDIAVILQNRSNSTAITVSSQVICGLTKRRRAAIKASMPRPAHHQKRMPMIGQLSTRHVLRFIPLGLQSSLAGFKVA